MENISFQKFLTDNREAIAEQLKDVVKPSFNAENPELYSPEIKKVLQLLRKPFPTQAQTIVAGVNHLRKNKSLIVSAEMGTGKTIMGIAMSYLFAKKGRVLIMAPSHLVPKWAQEIEMTLGKGNGAIVPYEIIIVSNYKDVIPLKNQQKTKLQFLILSKETAKLSYPREYYPRPKSLRKIAPKENDDGVSYRQWECVCDGCGSVLETFNELEHLNEKFTQPSLLQSKVGLRDEVISLKTAEEDLPYCSKCYRVAVPSAKQTNITDWLRGVKNTPLKGVARRLGVAEYIKKQCGKGFIDLLILDELHELKGGDTAQGNSFGQLASVSKKIVGLTGTLLNGYASSLFYILYRMNPHIMRNNLNLKFEDLRGFVDSFGAFEKEYNDRVEVKDGIVCKQGKSIKLKELPRINPLLIKELLPFTIFLRLDEMNFPLPNYKEEVVKVALDDEIQKPYMQYINSLAEIVKNKQIGGFMLAGQLANDSLSIPDLPAKHKSAALLDKETKDIITTVEYRPRVTSAFITNKDKKLAEMLTEELAQGRKCLVYVSYTNLGTTDRLLSALESLLDSDVCVKVLDGTIEPKKRDSWIKNNPCDVLITNPELVKTGLDLLDYPTIIFYQTGYNTFTLKQASRRSWRIGQKETCKVYFLVYEGTPQSVALALMSRKIKVANLLEGRLVTTENELGAFCEEISIQDEIARAILSKDSGESEEESASDEWVFEPRAWNTFESFYCDKKQDKESTTPKVVSPVLPKQNVEVEVKPAKTAPVSNVGLFNPTQKVSVTIYKGSKAKVIEMSGDDIIKKLETENSGGGIQLSLF